MSTDTNNHDKELEKAEVRMEDDGKELDSPDDRDVNDVTIAKETGQTDAPAEKERKWHI